MTKANLEGNVVGAGFWPKCGNCQHFSECEESPKHPAFPHTWHWSRAGVTFPDESVLLVRSWVGSGVYGHGHTGCYGYKADEQLFIEPDERHARYLALAHEMERLEQRLNMYESNNVYNDTVRAAYERFNEIIEEQDALTRGEAV